MNALLLALLVLLQILDWLLTRRLLLAGVAREANPVTAFFIRHAGINLGIATPKVVSVVAAWVVLTPHAGIPETPHADMLLFLLSVVYAGIVVWNYSLVRSKLD